MIVIGFNFPIIHDNTVAVIQDGKLVFAIEEERFTRHKHSEFEPPLNALKASYKYLLKRGIKPKDVDAYAVNSDPSFYPLSQRRGLYGGELRTLVKYGINPALPININSIRGDIKALLTIIYNYLKTQ